MNDLCARCFILTERMMNMVRFCFVCSIVLFSTEGFAQLSIPSRPDSVFSTYYQQRVTHFKTLPLTKGDIIFLGNSITDGAEWSELFADLHMKNRGISGDVSAGVIHRLDEVANRRPAKLFLMIGINDLAGNVTPDSIARNIFFIAAYIRQQSPSTKLYVQSILPVNDMYGKFSGHTKKGIQIKELNEQLRKMADEYKYTFIDLYSSFCNEEGKLKAGLSNDGLHLKGEGYLLWKHLLYPFVYDLQQKPALIPLPQQLNWNGQKFPVYSCKTIVVRNKQVLNEAAFLQKELAKKGIEVKLVNQPPANENYIEIALEKGNQQQGSQEAYTLEVVTERISIKAATAHGVFNGIQTLLQLNRDQVFIDGCSITDWPAFSWRGYMIDVGRNYQSVELLKQQIDKMASYKLTVFHFHPTEDIAWRIAIKQYPQLTAPENMLRNKGMYYTTEEIKELIAYCKARHIEFVPEIDMPGHSAAFKRAMHVDMQSDSGIVLLKNIIREVCTTYDLSYLHIGADEVKITNQQFIPEITDYIQKLGKKVIGWQPGGNFTEQTIRQLWMDDMGKISGNAKIQYIDSRHLYLNHMDPLESVVTIFNRKIGNKERGDASALGGTICMWHDRAVATENDVLRMNPVYPSMLAFAERSWRGGGHDGWVALIGQPASAGTTEFIEFENRLLDHQQLYFTGLPFTYVQQSSINWKIFGPYKNEGLLSQKFEPEMLDFNEDKQTAFSEVTGGTIILRHWWYPLIKGVIETPTENTTFYATTRIWSDEETYKRFWIGFNNLSRSPATDSPPENKWDQKESAVWVNGRIVNPPSWKRGGQKGNAEIPLLDEGYEYREPMQILLKKGWNTVLIKAPVGSFKGTDWQNPVKWMFTFVPLEENEQQY